MGRKNKAETKLITVTPTDNENEKVADTTDNERATESTEKRRKHKHRHVVTDSTEMQSLTVTEPSVKARKNSIKEAENGCDPPVSHKNKIDVKENTEEQHCEESRKTSRRKHKKQSAETSENVDSEIADKVESCTSEKKSRKSHKAPEVTECQNAAESEKKAHKENKKSKHRKVKASENDELEKSSVTSELVIGALPSKSHKKCKNLCADDDVDNKNNGECWVDKKRNKKSKRAEPVCRDSETVVEENVAVPTDEKMHKKKKHKKSKDDDGPADFVEAADGGEISLFQKKNKSEKNETEYVTAEVGSCCDKQSTDPIVTEGKKRKNRRREEAEEELSTVAADGCCQSVTLTDVSEEQVNSKSSKRKRKHLTDVESTADSTEPTTNSICVAKTSKSKSSLEKSNGDDNSRVSANKNDLTKCEKKKRKQKTPEISACDSCSAVELSVNNESTAAELQSSLTETSSKERQSKKRKKQDNNLQSAATEVTEPCNAPNDPLVSISSDTMQSASSLGQWKNVTFDAPERQQKFLRLLGGMKTSVSSSDSNAQQLKPSRGLFGRFLPAEKQNSSPSSLAMSASQQNHVEKSLEEQFEKAREMAFNKQKGIGLGFEAPPGDGKKLYIDTSAVRSKTFDD